MNIHKNAQWKCNKYLLVTVMPARQLTTKTTQVSCACSYQHVFLKFSEAYFETLLFLLVYYIHISDEMQSFFFSGSGQTQVKLFRRVSVEDVVLRKYDKL